MSADDSRNAADAGDIVYKTKIVEFLGRSTPIILQNGNGPCPLLSICNVLLLRNNLSLNLSEDVPEVSLQRLLSIVAEKLIDSNSNVQGKDDDYVTNQEQNIADAIDLLPRLATGIDVNVQFKRIDDFEFTRECAIFDLFDIGLYHGWIVDPQDTDTAAAIGTKSYNSLVGELVTFDTRKLEGENKSISEEDYVDFAAATTATLGVPSPCLSRGRSFDDCPVPVPVDQLGGRGDIEEAVELRRVLDLSIAETSSPVDMPISSAADSSKCSLSSNEITDLQSFGSVVFTGSLVAPVEDQPEKSNNSPLVEYQESSALNDCKIDGLYSKAFFTELNSRSPSIAAGNKNSQPVSEGSGESFSHNDTVENYRSDRPILNQATSCQSTDEDDLRTDMPTLNLETTYKPTSEDYSDRGNSLNDPKYAVGEYQSVLEPCSEDFSEPHIHHIHPVNLMHSDSEISSSPVGSCENFHSSTGAKDLPAIAEVATSRLEVSEPIYEGEEKMVDSGHPVYEGQEPVYEGEAVLAEQADKVENDTCSGNPKHATQQQWQLIKNFLDSSASQLTIYGLFCLQEGLKERELCVFFRNNHFSTMFKFEGQLYLLATDQGYITQPDLVWEKLNEVNGDTVFMTGNFKEFKADDQVSGSWNEQNAMTTTTDYLATLESSSPSRSDVNSDLQLAIALQQQEFEQQPQRNQQQPLRHKQQSQQQPSLTGRSRLVTGPQQGPRNSNASQKNEKKEKCVLM